MGKPKEIIIRNSFLSKEDLMTLSAEIFYLVKEEEHLSFRKRSEIKKILKKGMINCLFVDNELAGFLFSHHLSKRLVEINGLYIRPKFRKNNFASQLINHAIKDPKTNYFAVTFIPKVGGILQKLGFNRTDLDYLNGREKISFALQRIAPHRFKEVLRHRKKATLLLFKKECLQS